jgi:multiple sugar transport system substrate-binding protein
MMKLMSRLMIKTLVLMTVALFASVAFASGTARLTFMTPLTGADGPWMEKLVERFNAEHPEINVTHLVVPGGLEFNTKLATGIAAATAPGIVFIRKFDMARFLPYLQTFSAEELRDDFGVDVDDIFSSLMEGLVLDGKVYGIPMDCWIYMFSYNRAHFVEAGLDPDRPPTNLEEFIQAAQLLRKPEIDRWAIYVTEFTWDWLNWVYQYGGELLTEDWKEVAFNTEAGVAALSFICDLVHKYKVAPIDPGDAVAAFREGMISMRIYGVWDIVPFIEALGPDYGVAGVPQIGTVPAVFGGNHVFALPAVMVEDPEILQAAMTFIKWLYDHQIDWVGAGQTPSRISVAESAEFMEKYPHRYIVAQQLPLVKAPPYIPILAELLDEIQVYTQAAFLGEMTPEDAIQEAAIAANRILEDYWAGVE